MSLININAPVARISAGPATANAAFANPFNAGAPNTIEIVNESDVIIYVKTGNSSVVATTSDRGILPGTDQVFTRNATDTHIAALAASGSSKSIAIYSGPGE